MNKMRANGKKIKIQFNRQTISFLFIIIVRFNDNRNKTNVPKRRTQKWKKLSNVFSAGIDLFIENEHMA